METLLPVMSELSDVVGVPAVLCLAWVVFIIRDHGHRLNAVEQAQKDCDTKRAEELNKIYDRINDMASDVNFIRGQLQGVSSLPSKPAPLKR